VAVSEVKRLKICNGCINELFLSSHLGQFMHTFVTTPVVSALENHHAQSSLGVPAGILNRFWIQVAVSEVKLPSHGRFRSKTVENL
jgi:hypothetical protein